MRIYLILSILVLIICEAQSQTPQFDQLFHEFISKYNRMYFTENEKEARFQIFKSNYLKIYQHNEVQKDWRMEINRFTDMRDEEQKRMFHNLEINLDEISINNTEYNENENENIYNNKILKIDWTSKCGRIQDQMDCGSCYAFSAVESLQFAHFQQTTNFEYFSQQQIVDCSQDYGNDGCYGGLMENVFKYTAHKGILTAREYPYHAIKDRCRKEGGWKNYGYQNAPRNNDNLLAAALMERPISVAVDADTWTYYAGGKYNIYIYIYIRNNDE